MGADVIGRVYTLTFQSTLIFAIAVAAVREAVVTPLSAADGKRAHASALVAVLAAANLYGGTIPGGGWGRMVETLPGTLLTFGIAAHLLSKPAGHIAGWWARNVWLSPKLAGIALGLSAVAVSGVLLVKNQAYRPKLDVGLRAMTGRAQGQGWRGLRGDPLYVSETDSVLSTLRALPAEQRQTLYVFPLNALFYPLTGARNATQFDSHQVDFLAPSKFAEVTAQLARSKPFAIVMQRLPNQALGPDDADYAEAWVRPAIWANVKSFVHANYQLTRSWRYYELWTRRS
jgi:hypothetical protein